MRSALAIVLVVSLFLAVSLPRAVRLRPHLDELTWGVRSLIPWWFPEEPIPEKSQRTPEYQERYYFCIHHPTVTRIIYRAALHAAGVYDVPANRYDYSLSYARNMELGNHLERRACLALRITNAVFTASALAVLFLCLTRILNNRLFAFLALLPIIFDPVMWKTYHSLVPYIGADALLLFFLAIFLLAWLHIERASVPAVIGLGVLGGLVTGTKLNGAFVLAAALVYYAFTLKGARRFVVPFVMLGTSVVVFVALNPVYLAGGVAWAWQVFGDTVRLMFYLKNTTAGRAYAAYTSGEITAACLPWLYFAVPLAALFCSARKAPWFGRTVLWSASIIAGNLAILYLFSPRYAAPMRAAFWVAVVASAFTFLKNARSKPPCRVPQQPADRPHPASSGPCAGVTPYSVAAALALSAAAMAVSLLNVPVVVLMGLLLALLAGVCQAILKRVPAAIIVVAPLAALAPWTDPPEVAQAIVSFALATAGAWAMWLFIARRGAGLSAAAFVSLSVAASLCLALSPQSLPLLILAALLSAARAPRREASVVLLALVAAPFAAAVAFEAAGAPFVEGVGPLVTRLGAPARYLWNIPLWSGAVHGGPYNVAVMTFNTHFHWWVAAALAPLLWPLRHRWWFTATLVWAAALSAGTLIYAEKAPFHYGLPLQMALLIPLGLAGAEGLMKELGVERK